jgi:hypothetical protein
MMDPENIPTYSMEFSPAPFRVSCKESCQAQATKKGGKMQDIKKANERQHCCHISRGEGGGGRHNGQFHLISHKIIIASSKFKTILEK